MRSRRLAIALALALPLLAIGGGMALASDGAGAADTGQVIPSAGTAVTEISTVSTLSQPFGGPCGYQAEAQNGTCQRVCAGSSQELCTQECTRERARDCVADCPYGGEGCQDGCGAGATNTRNGCAWSDYASAGSARCGGGCAWADRDGVAAGTTTNA
jgi:hypothetical protein